MLIYTITNTINGKMYVGQTTRTVEARMRDHKNAAMRGEDYPLYRDIRKYGWEAFSVQVIAYAETKEILDDLEEYYIKKFNTIETGYNQALGGSRNVMESEVVANHHDAVMRTDEVRKKISNSMKLSYQARGGVSAEHRANLSKARMEFLRSERGIAATKKFRETFKLSESHKAALIGSLMKKVVCFDESGALIQEFDSVKEAAQWWIDRGCTAKTVKSVCGKIKRSNDLKKAIDGYRWEYRV